MEKLNNPLSIYIHIPFCRRACSYCDFYFVVSRKQEDQFFQALLQEIDYRLARESDPNRTITSIYFGGGTPSFAKLENLEKILQKLYLSLNISPQVEITLEANPDDLTPHRLDDYLKLGINRISLGVQAFDEKTLQYLERLHDRSKVLHVMEAIQERFSNWSIDLIFGAPTLSIEAWQKNLETSLTFSPPHLSLYSLTVEPQTALYYRIAKQTLRAPDEGVASKQFSNTISFLTQKDYLHYEISNYAKQGFYSQHNLSYWLGQPYWGLGPAAHSYDGERRSYNLPALSSYINTFNLFSNQRNGTSNLQNKIEEVEKIVCWEKLSLSEKFNEYLLVSLRTMWGCDLTKIKKKFGEDYQKELLRKSQFFFKKKWLFQSNQKLKITNKGKIFTDSIIRELFK